MRNPLTRLFRKPQLETLEDRRTPATYSFAGFTFEQDSTPDVETFLQPGTVDGAVVTSAPTDAAGSVVFPDQPAVGFNTALTLGTPLNNTGTSRPLNLPAGNNGTNARSGIELSWSAGRGLANQTGDDLVFYESGSTSTSPEAFMVQVHNAVTNTWTSWYYEPADAFALYGGVGVEGAFATAVDLSDLGVGSGEIIDRVRIVNMTDEDRMVDASGIGAVIPEDNGATSSNFPDPGPLASFTSYGSSTLDPDPLYVGAFNALSNTLVDVGVTKSSPGENIPVGSTFAYTLTVSNNGGSAANNVALADTIPAFLTDVTWTSQANGGATGNTDGSGDINETLNLPVGSSVVYTITATLAVPTGLSLTNTATVAVDSGNTDSNPADNTAAETDAVFFHPAFALTPTADLYTPHPNADADEAFVKGLYHQVLGRDGDGPGVAGWLQSLADGDTREDIVDGFVNSVEYRERQVASYYQRFLDRSPDAGSTTWVDQLLANRNEADVIAGILTSAEFTSNHPTDTDFITQLYQRLIGRAPDGPGLADWQAALAGGMSRFDAVRTFLKSQEAASLATESLYVGLFQRVSDSGRQTWIADLQSGDSTFTQVFVGFLISTENADQASANVP